MSTQRFRAGCSLTIAVACVLASAGVGNASSVTIQDLRPGALARIDAPILAGQADSSLTNGTPRTYLIGRLDSLTYDTLILSAVDGSPIAVPVSQIRRLDIETMEGNQTIAGLGIGFLFGTIVGAGIGASLDDPGGFIPNLWLIGAGVGAALGTATGAIIGSLIPAKKWTRVDPWFEGTGLRLSPRGDARVSYTLRF